MSEKRKKATNKLDLESISQEELTARSIIARRIAQQKYDALYKEAVAKSDIIKPTPEPEPIPEPEPVKPKPEPKPDPVKLTSEEKHNLAKEAKRRQ